MKEIVVLVNKTLKLQNLISVKMDMSTISNDSINTEISKLNTFIKTHGGKQIGPLIQYSEVVTNKDNEVNVNIQFMLQADNFIYNVVSPYHMESLLRVKNCLYARYIGPDDKVKFAYDKLGVYAFENDIELEGCNYTIYVDRNEEEETIIADVFMPIKQ